MQPRSRFCACANNTRGFIIVCLIDDGLSARIFSSVARHPNPIMHTLGDRSTSSALFYLFDICLWKHSIYFSLYLQATIRQEALEDLYYCVLPLSHKLSLGLRLGETGWNRNNCSCNACFLLSKYNCIVNSKTTLLICCQWSYLKAKASGHLRCLTISSWQKYEKFVVGSWINAPTKWRTFQF